MLSRPERAFFFYPSFCEKKKRGKKEMTKRITLISALLLIIITLTSCSLLFGEVADEGSVSIIVESENGSYTAYEAELKRVENKSEGAKGLIEYLSALDENALYLEMQDGAYGAYVSAIGDIRENGAEGKYVIIYTSVASDSYEGAPTVQYNGTTLYQSGLGLSGMSIEDGTIILFRVEKY